MNIIHLLGIFFAVILLSGSVPLGTFFVSENEYQENSSTTVLPPAYADSTNNKKILDDYFESLEFARSSGATSFGDSLIAPSGAIKIGKNVQWMQTITLDDDI